ncbi:histidine kinase [Oceanicola sp. 22II-s10i]|uniref:ATP-binding protein n=1 Tax=Oceanicola sp. 22II-s10i TaxID=1317116 RepID=UPI000B524DC5|nr:ATP-binding protein [Oceanicola sp. 22II-s10i]OWU84718.1 histidine kinase [Oceanicola sp. 22II-s10i]
MFFGWLKRYVPRGLIGRATLTLILPVVVIQLVVSIVFIQRHFEDVTDQMTTAVSRELDLLLAATPGPGGVPPIGLTEPLGMQARAITEAEIPPADDRVWYDFSGGIVTERLKSFHPGLRRVVLEVERNVYLYIDTPEGPIELIFDRERVSASNPHQLLVNMVFFGGLMTAIAYVYLRNQLRPITRLAEVSAAFGRGRNLPYKPGGATEVRAAGQAFVDMRHRIERYVEQRTLMLSGVSHDLRTPLTRLRLGLSLLDDEDREPLERDVAEMQEMIEGFLSFARGSAEDAPEPAEPVQLVREIVADARRGGAEVSLGEVQGAGVMDLRTPAVRRAVENLIGNAVRHGTRAEVSVVLGEKSLRISVEDDGPGIAEKDREAAMRPFQRLDPARNRNKGGGVGLGLSIAADVARAHGGVLRLGVSKTLGGLRADLVIAR